MEQHTTSGLAAHIGELEQLVHSILEDPEQMRSILEYHIALNDGYQLELRDEADKETGRHMSGAFVDRAIEPVNGGCSRRLVFSCIYEHDEDRLHGIWHEPFDASLAQDVGNKVAQACLQKIALLAQHIHHHADRYKARRLFDEEKVDEDDSSPLIFAGLTFEVKDEALDPALRMLHNDAMSDMNPLLAAGAYRLYRAHALGEDGPWLEANALSGPEEHFPAFVLKLPQWAVSYDEEGLEYEFEKTSGGAYEAKTSPADHGLRYGHFESFDPIYDEKTGELVTYTISEVEVEACEQADREAGLFEPTIERVADFIARLRPSQQ